MDDDARNSIFDELEKNNFTGTMFIPGALACAYIDGVLQWYADKEGFYGPGALIEIDEDNQ